MILLLEWSMNFLLFCILLAMVFSSVRLLIGPRSHDRILALDTLWMCCALLALALGMRFGSLIYFEVAMLIAIVGFVSTVALTKFLMRGEIIE